MSAYSGKSKRLKNALVLLLQGITYDTGSGAEPAFANVLDNNRGVFNGDPNVQVLPGDVTVDKPTTGQADKVPAYIIRIRIPMEDNDKSQSAAYEQMYDLTDLVIDAIDKADHNSTLVDGHESTLGVIGTYMMDATRGDWVEYPTGGGVELICDVNVQITYSQQLQ